MSSNDNTIVIKPQLNTDNTINVTPQLETHTISASSSFDKMVTTDGVQVLTNKTIDALYNTISNINIGNFAKNVIVTYIENKEIASNTKIPTEKAVADAISKAVSNRLTTSNIKAGTNISISVSGNDVTISSTTDVTGLLKADGSIPMDSNYEPVGKQDIATKTYVDTNIDLKVANKLEQDNIKAGSNIHIVEGTGNDLTISADKTNVLAGENVHVVTSGNDVTISADKTEVVAGENVHVTEGTGGATVISADKTNVLAGENIHVETSGNDVTISADKTEIVAGENVHVTEGTGGSTIISADKTELVAGSNISIEELTGGAYQINSEVEPERYTNSEGCIAVGGIKAGTTFNNQTMKQMWDFLLYPELYPTLTNPSLNIGRSPSSSYYEIGAIIEFTVTASFSRGSINPAYGTSGYRSGLPNKYVFSGAQMGEVETTDLRVSQSVTNYTVLSGSQSWSCRTYYDGGEQPKTNKGSDYSTPLVAGSVSNSFSFSGVYPYFATTSNLNTLTKQALTSMSSSYVQVTMVSESDTSAQKQRIEFPQAWKTLTGIQFFNTLNNTWEWIDGSKANSLLTFTKTSTTETVQGATIDYYLYTNNKSTTGSRQLRFYTS